MNPRLRRAAYRLVRRVFAITPGMDANRRFDIMHGVLQRLVGRYPVLKP